MQSDVFEWSAAKARADLAKHGVRFADAVGVFEDDQALTVADRLSAIDEQRWLTLGRDRLGRILVVAYTCGERLRILYVRRASARERRQYRETSR